MPQERSHRPPTQLAAAAAVTLPGAVLGALSYLGTDTGLPPYLLAVVFGTAIVGAAFLLSWGAEAIQVDVSAGLALAVLAFVAVLPEYAVDFVFTFEAGRTFATEGQCVPPGAADGSNPCSLALANMTGANRVLVGVGWPLLVLVAAWSASRQRRAGGHTASVPAPGRVDLKPSMSAEVVFLGFATLYSLTLPLRTSLTLVDAAVLVLVFVVYAWRLSQAPAEDPDLIGTSEWVAGHDGRQRHRWVAALFVTAGVVILLTAEHFAEGLVQTGTALGVDEFVLVQWLAPLASESPELIVACLYAWRLKASDSLGTLLSSKVNQWTLLVGTIPIVFAASSTSLHGLPLDTQQRLELLLTAAQSLFAVSLLVTLTLTWRGATALLVLFAVQFLASVTLSSEVDRMVIVVLSGLYGVLALTLFVRHGSRTVRLVRDGTVTPFHRLEEEDEEQDAAAR